MNFKYLEKCIRGWLPKEVSMAARQQPVAHRFYPTHRAIVAYVVIIAGAALVGALLGGVLGIVFDLNSEIGGYWNMAAGIGIGIVGALIYGKIYRREQQQKEAK
jgi:hypothetical protein